MKQMHKTARVLSVLMALIFLIQTMGASFSAFAVVNTVTGNVIGKKNFTITSPYADVDWDTWYQYKGTTHVHTHTSDGSEDINEMIEKYYELGYEVMAITDHGTVNYGWTKSPSRHSMFTYQWFVHSDPTGITQARYDEITTGVGRENGIGMIEVPLGIELNGASTDKVHINSFFADAGDGDMETDSKWPDTAIAKVQKVTDNDPDTEGVCHINHVGEWSGGNGDKLGTYNESFVNRFSQLFRDYSVLVGMELVNTADGRTRNDRYLYDEVLKVLAPEGKNVHGFCSDDSHEFSDTNRNANFFIMPEQTWQNVRTSMKTGAFFACSKFSKNPDELGDGFEGTGDYPRIQRITVDQDKDQIIVKCTKADKIRLVADGEIIEYYKIDEEGDTVTFDLNAYEDEINSYVRMYLTGPGGICYVQPFLVSATADNTCTVKFNLPGENTEFVLKDSTGKTVAPESSDYTYALTPGTYKYTATKFGFVDKVDIPFTLTQAQYNAGDAITVDVTLEKDDNLGLTYFYVPETIYTDAMNAKTFKYFVDRENAKDGALNATATKTTGNIYFFREDAENVTISAEVYTGQSGLTISGISFAGGAQTTTVSATGSTLSTQITSGSFGQVLTQDAVIKWTASYRIAGATLKSYAYSYVYKTLYGMNSVLAAGGKARTGKAAGWMHSGMSITGTLWFAGLHSVSGGSASYKYPYYGNGSSGSFPGDGVGSITDSGIGMSTAEDSSSGGSKSVTASGSSGTLTIDTSRVTNFNQIPYLAMGMDVNDVTSMEDSKDNYLNFGGVEVYRQNLKPSSNTRLYLADNSGSNKINRAVNTGESSIQIVGVFSGGKSDRTDTVNCNISITMSYVNKDLLRTYVNNEINKGYQTGEFTSQTDFNQYIAQLANGFTVLGNPKASNADVNNACAGIVNATNKLARKTSTMTVSHKYTSGQLISSESIQYTLGTKLIAETRDLDGCVFANWNVYANGASTPYYTGNSGSMEVYTYTDDMEIDFLYEANVYDVTFDTLGGSFSAPVHSTITFDTRLSVPSVTPSRVGLTFKNWILDCDGQMYNPGDSFIYRFTQDAVFTANYAANAYTITYDLDGGDTSYKPDSMNETVIHFGNTYTLPQRYPDSSNPDREYPQRTGYIFGGWYLDALDKTYPAGATMTWDFPQNGTFTALWTAINYTVTFSGGDGATGSQASVALSYDESFTLPEFGGFTKTGFDQVGWLFNGQRYYPGMSLNNLTTEDNGTVNFVAEWSNRSFIVSFNTGTSDLSYPDIRVEYLAKYGNLPTLVRPGYRFEGWFLDGSDTPITADTIVSAESNHTLYAHWTLAKYTVQFSTGTTQTLSPITVTYSYAYGTLPTITKTGYDFSGWYLGTNLITASTTVSATEDHTLVAKWTIKTVHVHLVPNYSGAVVSDFDIDYNQPYGSNLPELSRDDYWFRGWYLGDTLVTAQTLVTTETDHELQARWEQFKHVTVTFDSATGSKDVVVGAAYGTLPKAEKAGYTFVTWTYDGNPVDSQTIVTAEASHQLVAQFSANTYTVHFDTGFDDLQVRSKSVTFGSPYGSAITVPSYDGYTFNKWMLDGVVITAESVVSTATEHTLVAVWDANSYTVSFSTGFDDVTCKPISVTFDQPYEILPTPQKAGYDFSGWMYFTTRIDNSTLVSVATDHTLTAQWTNAKYTVSFDTKGGTACDPITVVYDSIYSTLPTSTKRGYTLAGWSYNGEPVYASTKVTETKDHTLEAIWSAQSYEVLFDSEGGDVCSNIVVTYGQAYGSLPVPTKPGYSFDGWFLNGVLITEDTIVSMASVHTLIAQWTALPTYIVTFDSNGGSEIQRKTVTYLMPYGKLESPERDGYYFANWTLGSDVITESTIVSYNGDHELVAQWTPIAHSVLLDAANGTALTSIYVNSDSKYGDALPTPTRNGYTFAGWYYGDVLVDGDSMIVVNSGHTLTAHWTPISVTVTFDPGEDGIVSTDTIAIDYDAFYRFPEETIRYGCVFVGWYDENDKLITTSVQMKRTDAHTLTAKWTTGTTYTITFDSNGGSACDPMEVAEGEPIFNKLPVPQKYGYNFSFWYIDYLGAMSGRITEDSICEEAMNLVAQYTAVRFDVTLNYADGRPSFTKNVAYKGKYNFVNDANETPTRTGYTFDGWFLGDTQILSSTVINTIEPHTLTAHWTANVYTVNFEAYNSLYYEPVQVTYGQPYANLPVPVLKDFKFLGWSVTEQASDPSELITNSTIMNIDTDHKLYAQWKQNIYVNVSFDSVGGPEYDSVVLIADELYGTLPTPTKAGYRFGGWYLDAEKITADSVIPAQDHTLVAHWNANAYKVSFISNCDETFDDATVVFGNPYGSALPTPKKDKYRFLGWMTEDSEIVDADTPVMIPENHTLVAQWEEIKYTVTWTIGSEMTSVSYVPGQTIIVPAIPDVTGYTAEWNADIPSVMPENNLFFSAIYSAIVCAITYTGVDDISALPQTHVYDTTTALPNLSKTGYDFLGWSINGGTVQKDVVLAAKDYLTDISVEARWQAHTFPVSINATLSGSVKLYDSDGNYLPIMNGSRVLEYGERILVKPVSICGSELKELYMTDDKGVRTALNGNYWITVTGQFSITAIYADVTQVNTVRVVNGTVNARQAAYVPMYGMVTVSAEAKKDGQNFAYWAIDSEAGQVFSYDPICTFVCVSDIRLVAVYSSATVEKEVCILTAPSSDRHVTQVNDTNSLSYFGYIVLPEGCTLVEAGLLLTNANPDSLTADNFVLGADSVVALNAATVNEHGLLKVSVNRVASDQTRTGRFYLTYIKDGVTYTVYSDTWSTLTTA